MKKQVAFAAALAAGITAQAATVYVSGDITNSTVWTSDNVYTMTNQVFVLPGASEIRLPAFEGRRIVGTMAVVHIRRCTG